MNDIERMMIEYPKAWSAHDVDKVLTFFNDDCSYEDPTLGVIKKGKEGVVEFAKEVFAMQPDFHLEYNDFFATETKGAAVWTIKNTWNGEFHGKDCTGIKVSFTGVSMIDFKNGKISRNVDYWDLTPLLKQLGVTSS